MKKGGVSWLLFLLVFFSLSLVFAADNTTTISNATTSHQDPAKITNGFACLESKVGTCSGLGVQETALTILATPKNSVLDSCVTALKNKMNSKNNWGNVRDTALAILALDHVGVDTKNAESWLANQSRTPTDLQWYLEQDSNTATQCRIGYGSNDYTLTIDDTKKFDKNAGTCLTRSQSNFWLKIEPSCYDKEFMVECDKDFIATLLYKNKDSSTIYVLEGTQVSQAFGSIKLSVNAKCFGAGSCDYESTLWSTLVLLKKGYDITNYIPYIIAMSDTNKRYLPDSFIYALTNYEDYASKLVSSVKLGNYWIADKTAYNKFYDTALALIALGSSSSDQVTKARDWLLFSQGTNGCWQNSVKETAMVLWALEGRTGRISPGGSSSITLCSEAKYFCIPSNDCPSSDKRGNYFCGSLSESCCATENLKSCSQLLGTTCSGTKVCSGDERRTLDSNNCCLGECVERPTQTQCEQNYFTCMDSCSGSQESVDYACNSGQVCCKSKTSPTPTPSSSSSMWVWVLVILIIIVLVAIVLWVYREKIKAWMNKGKGNQGSSSAMNKPGMPPMGPPRGPPLRMPPRPFPQQRPIPQMTRPVMQPSQPRFRNSDRRDPEMSDTFKKLRDLSG